jgi:hypothetical protein
MALNYQFYNNTLQDVKDEIHRRERAYWPEGHINNSALAWNYQKTAYLILKALKVTYTPETKQTGPFVATTPTPVNTFSGQLPSRTTPASYKVETNNDAPVKSIQTPTAPILELYGPDYTKSNGTLKGAVLNSAEINVEGTYGSILKISVNFTVFDKDELDNYMNSFLRPGVDIGLEWGWTVDEFAGNKGNPDADDPPVYVNKSDIHGTVVNFSFSAKEDGTWDCSLQALGPSAMTYGFNADAKDSTNTKPDPSNFATYGILDLFRIIQDDVEDMYEKGDKVETNDGTTNCKKIWMSQVTGYFDVNSTSFNPNTATLKKKEGPIIYIYDLPSGFTPGTTSTTVSPYGGANTSTTTAKTSTEKKAFITLDNLISVINRKINNLSRRGLPNYTFYKDGKDICVGTGLNDLFLQTGPAEPKFAFTTQRNGEPGSTFQHSLSLRGSGETFVNQIAAGTNNIPIQHLVLVSVEFINEELHKILGGDKYAKDKKILSFLRLLFQQLETETGGIIDLELVPERNLNGSIVSISIVNKNGVPDGALDNINPFPIKMMTKGSVVRAMSIESKVPDAVHTEVATFTRSGLSYGDSEADNSITPTSSKTVVAELLKELLNLNKSYFNNVGTDAKKVTSRNKFNASVRDIYKKLFSIQQSLTLNTDGSLGGINNILDLKTAVFPIYLKLTLDGINGFLYGNAITTNWLPKQYRDSRIYWTVTKIRHMIQNNDWITELEAIYRVKEK